MQFQLLKKDLQRFDRSGSVSFIGVPILNHDVIGNFFDEGPIS